MKMCCRKGESVAGCCSGYLGGITGQTKMFLDSTKVCWFMYSVLFYFIVLMMHKLL